MSLKGKMAMLGIDHQHGSEFINHAVVKLLGKLKIEQNKSRAGHSGDNGLVETKNETKNGAVIRKPIGFGHIGSEHAEAVNSFHREYLNPYLKFHRPCAVPMVITEPDGKRRRVYRQWATPFALLKRVPPCESYLRPGRTLAELDQFAQQQSDPAAALAMQPAKRKLWLRIRQQSA